MPCCRPANARHPPRRAPSGRAPRSQRVSLLAGVVVLRRRVGVDQAPTGDVVRPPDTMATDHEHDQRVEYAPPADAAATVATCDGPAGTRGLPRSQSAKPADGRERSRHPLQRRAVRRSPQHEHEKRHQRHGGNGQRDQGCRGGGPLGGRGGRLAMGGDSAGLKGISIAPCVVRVTVAQGSRAERRRIAVVLGGKGCYRHWSAAVRELVPCAESRTAAAVATMLALMGGMAFAACPAAGTSTDGKDIGTSCTAGRTAEALRRNSMPGFGLILNSNNNITVVTAPDLEHGCQQQR